MKSLTKHWRAGLLAAGLLLSTSFILTRPLMAVAAQDAKKADQSFLEKMEQWQNEMSEKFRDGWKGLHVDGQRKSVSTASVDLREDTSQYILRLNLPDRDLERVEIKLEGDTLRIVAPPGGKAGRYEQSITLAGLASDAVPKIERKSKDNMIVVTVPKSSAVAGKEPSLMSPDPSLLPLSDWDRDVFKRMDEMRREMDRTFDEAFREFRAAPEYKGFFDEPRFGSSLELKEEGDNYVIRAYLPDRDMQNIDVTVEDRTVKIEAKEQESSKKEDKTGPLHRTRKAAYSQIFTLPGPVHGEKMQVDKKEGMLVVTLPKAK